MWTEVSTLSRNLTIKPSSASLRSCGTNWCSLTCTESEVFTSMLKAWNWFRRNSINCTTGVKWDNVWTAYSPLVFLAFTNLNLFFFSDSVAKLQFYLSRYRSNHVSPCLVVSITNRSSSRTLSRNRTIIISVSTDNHYTGISCNSGHVLDPERYQIIQLAPTMDLEHFSAIPDNYLGFWLSWTDANWCKGN